MLISNLKIIHLQFLENGKKLIKFLNSFQVINIQNIFISVEEMVLENQHLYNKLVECVLKEVYSKVEYTSCKENKSKKNINLILKHTFIKNQKLEPFSIFKHLINMLMKISYYLLMISI